VIAHRKFHGSLAHIAAHGDEHGGHIALTVRQELQTYRLSRSLKIHEYVQFLKLANCIVTRKGFGSHTVNNATLVWYQAMLIFTWYLIV
jgi:hypothetical protein